MAKVPPDLIPQIIHWYFDYKQQHRFEDPLAADLAFIEFLTRLASEREAIIRQSWESLAEVWIKRRLSSELPEAWRVGPYLGIISSPAQMTEALSRWSAGLFDSMQNQVRSTLNTVEELHRAEAGWTRARLEAAEAQLSRLVHDVERQGHFQRINRNREEEALSLGIPPDRIKLFRRVPVFLCLEDEPSEISSITSSVTAVGRAIGFHVEQDDEPIFGSWLKRWHIRSETPLDVHQIDLISEIVVRSLQKQLERDALAGDADPAKIAEAEKFSAEADSIRAKTLAEVEKIIADTEQARAATGKLRAETRNVNIQNVPLFASTIESLSKSALRLGLAGALAFGPWVIKLPDNSSGQGKAAGAIVEQLTMDEIQKLMDGEIPASLLAHLRRCYGGRRRVDDDKPHRDLRGH